MSKNLRHPNESDTTCIIIIITIIMIKIIMGNH